MFLFQNIGLKVVKFFHKVGVFSLLFVRILGQFSQIGKDRHLIFSQMQKLGVRSLPLVSVVSIFAGAVGAWQAVYQFKNFGLIHHEILGGAISAAIFIELSPILSGLIVAGRGGASMAAEIGSMKVTEQIDALETLAIDPVRYLALPRFLAGCIMLPILVIYSNFIAHLGAYFVSYFFLNVSTQTFFGSVQKYFLIYNVFSGLIKAIVFGGGIALIGCAIGFETYGGAEGVGQSTIKAFVFSFAFILIMDYMLAVILF
jgi:phospholipid/cholesterol/gamma-HCH transport system permease protein